MEIEFLEAGKPATGALEDAKSALDRFITSGAQADWEKAWRALRDALDELEAELLGLRSE